MLFGRESAGVPEEIHHCVDARLLIPMQKGLRSLNVSSAASMIAGEALRQLNDFSQKGLSSHKLYNWPIFPC